MSISWLLALLFTWSIVICLDVKIERLNTIIRELKKENGKLGDEVMELRFKDENKGTN